jgi:hypothetical protein
MIIDFATRPEERGGSADELRIWILVEDKNARRRIMELKQYATPAINCYQAQPPVHIWLAEIRRVFWPDLDGSAYDLVDVRSGGLFWIREKRLALFDVPYSSEKGHQIEFLIELAIYDANQLGIAHGRQAQAAAYRSAIEKNTDAFHEATSQVEKAYIEIAKKAFEEK